MSFIGNLCHAITLTPLESLIQRVNLSMPFGGILVRRLAHDAPSYSGVGASGKPGAVHLAPSPDGYKLHAVVNGEGKTVQ